MSMSKRDFADLAASIRTAKSSLQLTGDKLADTLLVIDALAENIADVCAKHNERFDREKFLVACRLDVSVPQGFEP